MSFILQRLQCLLPLHFKDYQSLLFFRDFNVYCLDILKTIKVFCLAETLMSSAFTFHFYQILLSWRDFNVFCLYISKTIKVFYLVETSMSTSLIFQILSMSFVLQRHQCHLPLHFKDYESLLSCRDFNVLCLYISKTIKVFCLAETTMSSTFTFQRLSMSFVLQGLQCLLPLHFKEY